MATRTRAIRSLLRPALLGASLLFLAAAPGWSEPPSAAAPAVPAAAPTGWPERDRSATAPTWGAEPAAPNGMGRYFLSLFIVAGLMAGTFAGLRKMRGALTGGTASGGLRVLARLPLDRHNTVHLLRTAHEVLTVASGPQGVQVLARHPIEPGDGAAEPPTAGPILGALPFLRALRARQREE